MDILALLRTLIANGTFARLGIDARAQFGVPTRRYLGAELLPERLVPANEFTEEGISYRSVIANGAGRYSPVQIKGGAKYGTFAVKLSESDIGSEFTARELDGLIELLRRNLTEQGAVQLINWAEMTLNRPLVEYNERMRWQAIVPAQVDIIGNNELRETVLYPNPAGHRTAAQNWSSDAIDPFEDIFAQQALLATKGLAVSRQITSTRVLGILGNNAKVQTRAGRIRVSAANGAFSTIGARASLAQINAALSEDGLPPIEIYDLQYRTMSSTGRFLADTVFVQIATTGRDESLDLGDTTVNEVIPNTLGYLGVGRPAGQDAPGRVIRTEAFDNKPPRIEGEGWQTSLPVILEPEAISVLTGI